MSTTVRTVTFTAAEQAALQTQEDERGPLAPDEVAGRSLVTLISAGTELAIYRNLRGSVSYPTGSGYAAVFVVDEAGVEVEGLQPGDHVFCMGGHRSYQRVRASEVVPLPAGLDPRAAVFARMMGVSMSTLVTTAARPPDKVVVTGLGVVGNLAAQVFQACGYEVIACDPVPERRAVAQSCGLRRVEAAVPLVDPLIKQQVALVVECSGHEAAVRDGCAVVQRRGEVVLTGVPWQQRTDLSAFAILDLVFHNYAVLRSGWEWEVPRHAESWRSGSIFANYRAALRWIADGRIRTQDLYTIRSPEDPQSAYQDLRRGRCDKLSILFDWDA